jgi:hypothetical protein
MSRLPVSAIVDKWVRNTSNATEALKAGVQAVTESPTEAAARAADRYVMGVQNAVSSGAYAAGLRRVSLDDWKTAMLTKGAARISQGVTSARPKMVAFMEKWMPYQEELSRRVASMPKGTLADSKARADFAIEYNAAFKR